MTQEEDFIEWKAELDNDNRRQRDACCIEMRRYSEASAFGALLKNREDELGFSKRRKNRVNILYQQLSLTQKVAEERGRVSESINRLTKENENFYPRRLLQIEEKRGWQEQCVTKNDSHPLELVWSTEYDDPIMPTNYGALKCLEWQTDSCNTPTFCNSYNTSSESLPAQDEENEKLQPKARDEYPEISNWMNGVYLNNNPMDRQNETEQKDSADKENNQINTLQGLASESDIDLREWFKINHCLSESDNESSAERRKLVEDQLKLAVELRKRNLGSLAKESKPKKSFFRSAFGVRFLKFNKWKHETKN